MDIPHSPTQPEPEDESSAAPKSQFRHAITQLLPLVRSARSALIKAAGLVKTYGPPAAKQVWKKSVIVLRWLDTRRRKTWHAARPRLFSGAKRGLWGLDAVLTWMKPFWQRLFGGLLWLGQFIVGLVLHTVTGVLELVGISRPRQKSFAPPLVWTLASVVLCGVLAFDVWSYMRGRLAERIVDSLAPAPPAPPALAGLAKPTKTDVPDVGVPWASEFRVWEHRTVARALQPIFDWLEREPEQPQTAGEMRAAAPAAQKGVPSPFATLLAESPFAPAALLTTKSPPPAPAKVAPVAEPLTRWLRLAAWPEEAESETKRRRRDAICKLAAGLQAQQELPLLIVALGRMHLRDATGAPPTEEKLAALAEHFRARLQRQPPDGQNLFQLGAFATLATYIQHIELSEGGSGQRETESQAAEVLARDLASKAALPEYRERPAVIVSAALAIGGVQRQLLERIEHAAAKAPHPLKEENGQHTAKPEAKAAAAGEPDFEFENWVFIHQILVRFVEMAQADDDVRTARFHLTFVDGIDQCVMYGLFFFVIALLAGRLLVLAWSRLAWWWLSWNLRRSAQAASVHAFSIPAQLLYTARRAFLRSYGTPAPSPDMLVVRAESFRETNARSRWLGSYCGRALPTVGFIGKVLGIAASMASAEDIARAQGSFAQAEAISKVSGSLGVAFTATLSAFALSLVLAFLDAALGHREVAFIDEVEHRLLSKCEESQPRRRRRFYRKWAEDVWRRTVRAYRAFYAPEVGPRSHGPDALLNGHRENGSSSGNGEMEGPR
ncbi:MAG: hypothetical protein JWL59_4843 [Chthoniobacteraceae bacterium]|nr:hypothetical protein [Chthoniobacteraceae bacterium]